MYAVKSLYLPSVRVSGSLSAKSRLDGAILHLNIIKSHSYCQLPVCWKLGQRAASVHRRSTHTPGSLAFGTQVYSRAGSIYGGTCSAADTHGSVCLSRRRASSQLKTELSASRSSLRGQIMAPLTDDVICDTHSTRRGNPKRRESSRQIDPNVLRGDY